MTIVLAKVIIIVFMGSAMAAKTLNPGT